MRRLAILLTVVLGLGALPAHADPTTAMRLMERGVQELRRAEEAGKRSDTKLAMRYAREAEATFRSVLEIDPAEKRAALFAGQAAVFAKNLRGARNWANRYKALSPFGERDPDLHYLRALIDLRVGERPDWAIRHLQRMQAVNARARPARRDLLLWEALDRYGWLLIRTGDTDKALRQFQTAERIARRMGHPHKVKSSRANYAIALQRQNRNTEAQEIFQNLLNDDPKNIVWSLYLALNLHTQHKFEEAIPHYRRVVDQHKPGSGSPALEPDLRRARVRLGNCYRFAAQGAREPKLRAKLLEDARKAIQAYIDLEPKDAIGPIWMGTLLFDDLEQPYAAEPYFVKAFALDPMCAQSLRRLIQIHEHYPPPPDASAEVKAAWKDPVAAWKKDLEENRSKRKAALDARRRKQGNTGCE